MKPTYHNPKTGAMIAKISLSFFIDKGILINVIAEMIDYETEEITKKTVVKFLRETIQISGLNRVEYYDPQHNEEKATQLAKIFFPEFFEVIAV